MDNPENWCQRNHSDTLANLIRRHDASTACSTEPLPHHPRKPLTRTFAPKRQCRRGDFDTGFSGSNPIQPGKSDTLWLPGGDRPSADGHVGLLSSPASVPRSTEAIRGRDAASVVEVLPLAVNEDAFELVDAGPQRTFPHRLSQRLMSRSAAVLGSPSASFRDARLAGDRSRPCFGIGLRVPRFDDGTGLRYPVDRVVVSLCSL